MVLFATLQYNPPLIDIRAKFRFKCERYLCIYVWRFTSLFPIKLSEGRFKDDNKVALQPFYIGPRSCIGRK
jgi:hypothetical protein